MINALCCISTVLHRPVHPGLHVHLKGSLLQLSVFLWIQSRQDISLWLQLFPFQPVTSSLWYQIGVNLAVKCLNFLTHPLCKCIGSPAWDFGIWRCFDGRMNQIQGRIHRCLHRNSLLEYRQRTNIGSYQANWCIGWWISGCISCDRSCCSRRIRLRPRYTAFLSTLNKFKVLIL